MSVLLDHTEQLVLRSPSEGPMKHTSNGSDTFDGLCLQFYFSVLMEVLQACIFQVTMN